MTKPWLFQCGLQIESKIRLLIKRWRDTFGILRQFQSYGACLYLEFS